MSKQEKSSIISERIRIAREKLGMNCSEAADYLNLSKMGYYRYETGERTPSFQTLTYIAQRFRTSVAYLTGETDSDRADQIVVNRNMDSDLYGLVEFYQNADDVAKNRLIAYWHHMEK